MYLFCSAALDLPSTSVSQTLIRVVFIIVTNGASFPLNLPQGRFVVYAPVVLWIDSYSPYRRDMLFSVTSCEYSVPNVNLFSTKLLFIYFNRITSSIKWQIKQTTLHISYSIEKTPPSRKWLNKLMKHNVSPYNFFSPPQIICICYYMTWYVLHEY